MTGTLGDGQSLNRRRPVNQLPPDVDLVGRENELILLESTLTPPPYAIRRASISSIVGEPGVGKSALAIHFAHTLRERYPDGQLYRDLYQNVPSSQPLEPSQVLRSFLRALGRRPEELPEDEEDLASEFRHITDGRSVVIVLDNVTSIHQVQNLVPRSPTCHVVITCRERFSALGIPTLVLEPLSARSALVLFNRIAPSRRPENSQEAEELEQVLSTCDGLPLVIRVLAARLQNRISYPLSAIIRDLERQKGLGPAFGPYSEEIVASFRLSYNALSTVQAKIFRRLGVVPGESFENRLAAVLADTTPDEAALQLERLSDLQLLQQTSDTNYYTMHSILRRFAVEQLDSELDESSRYEVLGTILEFYVRSANSSDRLLQPGSDPTRRGTTSTLIGPNDQERALAWLSAETINMVAAIKQACADGYKAYAWKLCSALVGMFEIRGDLENWRETHEAAISVLEGPDDSVGRAHILRGLGRLYRSRRAWSDAIVNYREAAALFRLYARAEDAGMTLHALGDVYRYMRNWDSAANCFTEALQALGDGSYPRGVAMIKRSLHTIPRVRGEFAEAETLIHEAISILTAEGDDRWLAATKLSLADIYLDRGHPESREILLECLETFEKFGDRHWQALTLRSLGEAMRLASAPEDALRYLHDSLSLIRDADDPLWEAQVLHCIGLVHLDQAKPSEALEHFNAALIRFKKDGDTLWEGRTYVSIGRAAGQITSDPGSANVMEAYSRAWPLLVEQGARADLEKLSGLIPSDLLNTQNQPIADQ